MADAPDENAVPGGPLRIVVTARAVAPWHGRGGLERHVADLVRHLVAQGVEVTLIVPPPRNAGTAGSTLGTGARAAAPEWGRPDRIRVCNVPYVALPGAGRRGTTILDRDTAYLAFGWRAGRLAARLAQEGLVDVVHGLGASVLGYALAKRRDSSLPPLVLNPQGLEEFGATDPGRARLKVLAYAPLRRAVRACAAAADAVLATDRSLVPVVVRHLSVPAERVPVVPNAVDLERCDRLAGPDEGRALRARIGLAGDVPLLLSVGRLEENKGFHVLADALSQLAGHGTEYRWALIGDGPYRAALARRARAGALGSRMIWAGRVEDAELHAWYEAADLFVHPTLYEGSSLVTLEAMAHRRPVVASRAGGLPDKVVPGVTGWLVPPADADGLAGALAEAVQARDRWTDLGTAARRLAEREFAWPPVAARLASLYRRLSAARPESGTTVR